MLTAFMGYYLAPHIIVGEEVARVVARAAGVEPDNKLEKTGRVYGLLAALLGLLAPIAGVILAGISSSLWSNLLEYMLEGSMPPLLYVLAIYGIALVKAALIVLPLWVYARLAVKLTDRILAGTPRAAGSV